MMITLRGLALVMFSALLAGCEEPCPPPGHPTSHQCWYDLHVTEINSSDGTVTATYTQKLIEGEQKASPTAKFTFFVRDLDWLVSKNRLKTDTDYLFTNGYGSPFLEPFNEGYYFNDKVSY
jgi:hypothetical protein